MSRTIFSLSIIAMALLATACTNPETPAGHEGYVFERPRVFGKGGFRGIVTGPGNFGVSAFRNEVINIDLRPRTYTEQFEILAKDDLNIEFRFHVIIGLSEGKVADVVVKYGGEDWFGRFVREPFRTFVRNAVQQYDSREVKANREVVAGQVGTKLLEHLEGTPFELVSLGSYLGHLFW